MTEPKAIRTVIVTNCEGLHLRAATSVAELVRRFDSEVKLIKNAERVEATEVLQICSLGAAQGERLCLEATGCDAEEVLDALVQLFTGNFDKNDKKTVETGDQP